MIFKSRISSFAAWLEQRQKPHEGLLYERKVGGSCFYGAALPTVAFQKKNGGILWIQD